MEQHEHIDVPVEMVGLTGLHDGVDVCGGYELEYHSHIQQAGRPHLASIVNHLLAHGLRNDSELVLVLELEVESGKVVAAYSVLLTRLSYRMLFIYDQRQA
jgi:hypothetical protein